MASINWRNVPASSFRVGKSNNPRSTMAACLSPAPQAGSQKDAPSIGQDQPSSPLATSELKHHCPKEDANTSILPSATQKEGEISGTGDALPEGCTISQTPPPFDTPQVRNFAKNFPSSAFKTPTFLGVLRKYLPCTSQRLTSLSLVEGNAGGLSKYSTQNPPNEHNILEELDDTNDDVLKCVEVVKRLPNLLTLSSFSVDKSLHTCGETSLGQCAVRPMDVPGILIGKREEKCTVDVEHDRYSNDLTELRSLSPESEEVVSKLATKRSRCLSGDTATSDSDASTSKHSKRGEKSSGKEKGSTPKKPSPNAFVSLRVSSPLIHKGLQAVQEGMVGKDEAVRSALTSLDKLHITLSVIRLENEDDQERYTLIRQVFSCVCENTMVYCLILHSLVYPQYRIHLIQLEMLCLELCCFVCVI